MTEDVKGAECCQKGLESRHTDTLELCQQQDTKAKLAAGF